MAAWSEYWRSRTRERWLTGGACVADRGAPLRNCPFCGGVAYCREWQAESLWGHAVVPWYEVGCHDCDVALRSCQDDDAVRLWNTRKRARK